MTRSRLVSIAFLTVLALCGATALEMVRVQFAQSNVDQLQYVHKLRLVTERAAHEEYVRGLLASEPKRAEAELRHFRSDLIFLRSAIQPQLENPQGDAKSDAENTALKQVVDDLDILIAHLDASLADIASAMDPLMVAVESARNLVRSCEEMLLAEREMLIDAHETIVSAAIRNGTLLAVLSAVLLLLVWYNRYEFVKHRRIQQRFDLAVDGSHDALWDWPRVGETQMWWSPRLYELLGYTPDEMPSTQENFRKLISPNDLEEFETAVLNNMSDGAIFEVEYQVRCANAGQRWVRMRSKTFVTSDGQSLRMAGSISDISTKKKHEMEMRRGQRRLAEAQRIALLGSWEYNISTHETWWSDEIKTLFQLPSDHPQQRFDSLSTLSEEDRRRWRDVYRQAASNQHPGDLDFEITVGENERRTLRGRVYFDDDSIAIIKGTIQDVTSAKQIETELRRAKEAAESASVLKSQFLANMSHEIRTPMTAILGFTDLLIEENQGQTNNLNRLETIRRNGQHLLQLINDILDLSKIEAGKLELEQLPCSLPALIEDVVSSMQVRVREKGLDLNVDLRKSVPDTIVTDPTRLRQIMMNLLGNAVKFTHQGNVRIYGRVSDFKGKTCVLHLDFADSGIGMDAEKAKRLFEPFTQADASTQRQFGGTGLGLAISRRLAQSLDGDLTVESHLGHGSIFHLTLPVKVESKTDLSRKTPLSHHDHNVLVGLRVLLAEDGVDNQRLIKFLLERAGIEVTLVDNGQAAVDALSDAHTHFDLMLMDMSMPILDGYQATARLRELGHRLPVIALTAHAMATDRGRCLEAGCTDYLTKPIDRNKLLNLLSSYAVALRHGIPQNADTVDGDLDHIT